MSRSPFIVHQELLNGVEVNTLLDQASEKIKGDVATPVEIPLSLNPTILKHSKLIKREIDQYFNVVSDLSDIKFNWISEGDTTRNMLCDSEQYVPHKWVKRSDVAFTTIILLSKKRTIPDEDWECNGGGFYFNVQKFNLDPELGTSITFPSTPYINYSQLPVLLGNFFYIKLSFTTQDQFVYNRKEFPGNHITWFETLDIIL